MKGVGKKIEWNNLSHLGCIYPCSGHPVLKTEPSGAYVSAHRLPVFLQCSECGYAPMPTEQPELLMRYLQKFLHNT